MCLKCRQYYEDIYDRVTVEGIRRGLKYYENVYHDFETKLPKSDKINSPSNSLLLNAAYMQFVGDNLITRYDNRTKAI